MIICKECLNHFFPDFKQNSDYFASSAAISSARCAICDDSNSHRYVADFGALLETIGRDRSDSPKPAQISTEDRKHLQWCYERLAHIHEDGEEVDYMLKFQKIIDSISEKPVGLLPFDIQKAIDGEPVVFVDQKGKRFNVCQLKTVGDHLVGLFNDGTLFHQPIATISNLYMLPKTRTVWVNLYIGDLSHKTNQVIGSFWTDKEFAECNSMMGRIGNDSHPITIIE